MSFAAHQVCRTQTLRLLAPPARVFPLFEPLGERAWAPDWAPRPCYPADGAAAPDAVFTTHLGDHDMVWTMPVYDPARWRIEYVTVLPGVRVGHIVIQCQDGPAGAADVTVSYTFTALDEPGNAFIATFTADHYQAMMADWERSINHYLAHGRPVAHA